jgi:hypothetical protein
MRLTLSRIPSATLMRCGKHLLAGLLLALSLTSCATPSFHRAWKAAASHDAAADPVAGRWEGTWKSDVNGHHGKLACITAAPSRPGEDHAFFYRATWMRVLSGSYRARHRVVRQPDGHFTFSGRHQMPAWAGGEYEYEGHIRGDVFTARYRCSMDRGTYEMRRVPASAAQAD